MTAFIRHLLALVRPYRTRLALGILCGVLSGMTTPLLVATIQLVIGVAFPENSQSASSPYSAADFRDLPAFATRLQQRSDPVSAYVAGELSEPTRQALLAYKPSESKPEPLQEDLIEDLNYLLWGHSLYDSNRFAGVTNSPETRQLLAQNPRGNDLVRLNRLLLEDAYPKELSRRSALTERLNSVPGFIRAPLEDWLSRVSTSAISKNRWLLSFIILLIPLVMLVRGVVSYLNLYCLEWVAVRAITDLRVRLFSHLVKLPLQLLHRSSTGDLMARVTNDTTSMQRAINSCLPSLVRDPVQVVCLASWLLWKERTLTLISIVLLPAVILPIAIFSRKVRKTARRIQDTLASLSSQMQEVFTGSRVVKAYNLESVVIDQFAAAGRRFVSLYMRVLRSLEIPGPLIEFFGALGVAAVLLYIKLFTDRPTALKDIAPFLAAILFMYQPIKALVRLQNQLVQSRAASERVFELLAQKSNLPEPAQPKPLRAVGATIHFDGVDFAYDHLPVLHGINLEIQPGQLVALVGQSGSGKTTLTNLLLRFHDPQRGAVRIGGIDIREFSTRDLRSQIALVTQETILFNDTIRSNIAVGRPGATDTEIEAAAKHAYAQEFILKEPQGYARVVGEKGASLSGGQRQRIALARAIVKDAPILVLDEATNALDAEIERGVQDALEQLMKGRTTICIAHRLSTIQKADCIVVLDQGRIVETGVHDELLDRRGFYWRLHELQFGGTPA